MDHPTDGEAHRFGYVETGLADPEAADVVGFVAVERPDLIDTGQTVHGERGRPHLIDIQHDGVRSGFVHELIRSGEARRTPRRLGQDPAPEEGFRQGRRLPPPARLGRAVRQALAADDNIAGPMDWAAKSEGLRAYGFTFIPFTQTGLSEPPL